METNHEAIDMIDKEKPIGTERIGISTRDLSTPYAVNKAGDFSKKSVREPEWPQDAAPKQPLEEINMNRSRGKAAFEDVLARVYQLGEIPRGAQIQTIASSDDGDSARGVSALPHSEPQAAWQKRLEDMKAMIFSAVNEPKPSFPFQKTKVKLLDKNDPGHDTNVKDRRQEDAPFIMVPSVSSDFKKELVNFKPERSELKTLDKDD
jgi:hypothetical protein